MKSHSDRNDYMKYIEVPEDKYERLEYIKDKLKIKESDIKKIKEEIKRIKEYKKHKEILNLLFYIVPEGIARPRMGYHGHFYVPNIQKFYDIMNSYMIKHKELKNLNIVSECKIDCKFYRPIPSDMTKIEKVLAELKFIKDIKKPDWDNLGKSTDMLHPIWLDDSLVIDGRSRKYYSFKPRIEIKLTYYKNPTNSYHVKSIKKIMKRKLKDTLKEEL